MFVLLWWTTLNKKQQKNVLHMMCVHVVTDVLRMFSKSLSHSFFMFK